MSLSHLIVLTLVAAVSGLIAERVVHRAFPYGWIGTIVAGFLGAWLMVDILHVRLAPELSIEGIPLLSAILGAIVVLFIYSQVSGSKLRLKRR